MRELGKCIWIETGLPGRVSLTALAAVGAKQPTMVTSGDATQLMISWSILVCSTSRSAIGQPGAGRTHLDGRY